MNKNKNYTLVCVPFSDARIIASIKPTEEQVLNQSWSIQTYKNGTFDFPESLLETLNWKEGDEINWVDQSNGTFTLTKLNKKTNGRSRKSQHPD